MVIEVPDPDRGNVTELLALTTAEHGTVREYLTELLCALWSGEADPKYGMTGESDWRYDLYDPMRDAGLIPAWQDGYGIGYREVADPVRPACSNPEDRERADELIVAAIRQAMEHPS